MENSKLQDKPDISTQRAWLYRLAFDKTPVDATLISINGGTYESRLFVGEEINDALKSGWNDSPSQPPVEKKKAPTKTETSESKGES